MKRLFHFALLLLALPAAARGEPYIVGDHTHPQCREALALASAAFRSDHFVMADSAPPRGWPARLLLSWNGLNNYGITFDKAAFAERGPSGDSLETLYWQQHAEGGKRFVGVDFTPNWKGDYFHVLLVDAALSEAAVRAALDAGTIDSPLNEEDQILFQDKAGRYGLLTLPQGYEVERSWTVQAVRANHVSTPCRIILRKWTGKPLVRLPPPVRDLAASLRHAVGPPDPLSNGFMSGRLEIAVLKSWANAVDRPWALSSYNNARAAFVRAGLRAWARQAHGQAAVLSKIMTQRVSAAHAMAYYYHRWFGLAPADAQRVGAFVIDYMTIPYFSFETTAEQEDIEAKSSRTSNPWPATTPGNAAAPRQPVG